MGGENKALSPSGSGVGQEVGHRTCSPSIKGRGREIADEWSTHVTSRLWGEQIICSVCVANHTSDAWCIGCFTPCQRQAAVLSHPLGREVLRDVLAPGTLALGWWWLSAGPRDQGGRLLVKLGLTWVRQG